MVTVLASESTPRLTYVLNFVFGIGNYRVVEAVSTTDINDITLCYTEEPCDAGIHIKPAGLIEERRHRAFTPQYAVIDSLPVLFPAPDTALGFDVFSALFYVLSRYEEYGSPSIDEHGRFSPTASIQYSMQCLERPICDEWRERLLSLLPEEVRRDAMAAQQKGGVVLTHDIDLPFRYRKRGIVRTSAALLRDMAKGKWQEVRERLLCVLHLRPDPYFNLTQLAQQDVAAGFEPIFFIHTGKRGRYDSPYIPSLLWRRTLSSALRKVAQLGAKVGLHPAYATTDIAAQAKRLRKMSDIAQIQLSRQHYLRFLIPSTPRALLSAGITDDYSLGYATHSGFRAGTGRPFPYFDLEYNVPTDLILHPLLAMDTTLRRDRHQTPTEAMNTFLTLTEASLRYGGEATLLIHNSTVAAKDEWQGWDTMYSQLLQQLQSLATAKS